MISGQIPNTRKLSQSQSKFSSRPAEKRSKPSFEEEDTLVPEPVPVIMPASNQGPEQNPLMTMPKDMEGNPLIDDIKDLGESVVFFDGFRGSVSEREIEECFATFGDIRIAEITARPEKNGRTILRGVVEFHRARDAKRCCLLMHGTNRTMIHRESGREYPVRIRKATELRKMPDRLKNLNRPMKETELVGKGLKLGSNWVRKWLL